jgi:hypothetical protein
MSWTVYQIILRLHSPLHIGYHEVGYLRRTRPYVTGRALRGALVNRVGRNQNIHGEEPGDPFRAVSKTFAQYLTFTYFYPALKVKDKDEWKAQFPWEDEADFRCRFLSSYVSTALTYPHQTAAEGLLHEIEFISPRTLDTGEPVYLTGYIFMQEGRLKREKYDWVEALRRLQLGGERGYGWGEAQLEREPTPEKNNLFGNILFDVQAKCPVLYLGNDQAVVAHTFAQNARLSGPVEPMVGREWRADNEVKRNDQRKHIGQHLAYNGVYFAPGSRTQQASEFILGEAGYWQMISFEKERQS